MNENDGGSSRDAASPSHYEVSAVVRDDCNGNVCMPLRAGEVCTRHCVASHIGRGGRDGLACLEGIAENLGNRLGC